MKAIKEPTGISVELIGGPKALVMSKTLMRDLFRLAEDNKVKRILVVLEK